MMSGFLSRVFGWEPKLTEEQLEAINNLRRGQKFVNEESAVEVNGSAMKPQLMMTKEWLTQTLFDSIVATLTTKRFKKR
jgi:hypothetical protein